MGAAFTSVPWARRWLCPATLTVDALRARILGQRVGGRDVSLLHQSEAQRHTAISLLSPPLDSFACRSVVSMVSMVRMVVSGSVAPCSTYVERGLRLLRELGNNMRDPVRNKGEAGQDVNGMARRNLWHIWPSAGV